MSKHLKVRSKGEQIITPHAQHSNNRTRWIVAASLGVILILFLGWWLSNRQAAQPATVVASNDLPTKWINALNQLPSSKTEYVEVAYFHRTQRCVSCKKAEQLIRKTLDTYFTEQMSSGAVRLAVADVQKSQNAAITYKYDAFTSALYFGVVKDGVEYLCPINDLWTALNDEARFMTLLHDMINVALGDG
jgi:hypothetical protein